MKKSFILSTVSALTLAGALAVPAFAMCDGSVRFDRSNGQPIIMSTLNPQPLPPGRHPLMISGYSDGTDGIASCAISRRVPPEPCQV